MAFAVAVLLCAASAHADEAGCIAARYSASGRYAGCEARAIARGGVQSALSKCRQNYAATWPKLQAKYPGTSCALARFVDNGSTITDNLTQLVWEKKTTAVGSGENPSDRDDVDNRYSWSATSTNADGTAFTDFLDNLNSTGFAGQHDWRLPTVSELQTILLPETYPCAASPCVDPIFVPTQSGYWSSSTYQDYPDAAWYVYFAGGGTTADFKPLSYYVRGVRAGS